MPLEPTLATPSFPHPSRDAGDLDSAGGGGSGVLAPAPVPPPSSPERHALLAKRLPEQIEIESLATQASGLARVVREHVVSLPPFELPVYSFAFGSTDVTLPTIAFVGGVHGLERIGTNVAISYLKTMLELVQWDQGLNYLLSRCRIVIYPLVNPGGMLARRRSNPRGVDLMRNAPLDAKDPPNVALVCGHRISSRLPYYRGAAGAPVEGEAAALTAFIRRELFASRFSLALDMHSGFGMVDRIWFPYAYSRRPFEHLDLMHALKERVERSLPNHPYIVEPQSLQYVTHGDLWDWLLLEQRQLAPSRMFLPLTLEMGSWLWIKKNPWQAFSLLGIFNPMKPHRLQRTLRRHHPLLDFFVRASASHEHWAGQAQLDGAEREQRALDLWYGGRIAAMRSA